MSSLIVFISFILFSVSCWRGTHVGEGILVFKGYLGVFSLINVVGGYFSHESSREGFMRQILFIIKNFDRGTLFIKPTTSQSFMQ